MLKAELCTYIVTAFAVSSPARSNSQAGPRRKNNLLETSVWLKTQAVKYEKSSAGWRTTVWSIRVLVRNCRWQKINVLAGAAGDLTICIARERISCSSELGSGKMYAAELDIFQAELNIQKVTEEII